MTDYAVLVFNDELDTPEDGKEIQKSQDPPPPPYTDAMAVEHTSGVRIVKDPRASPYDFHAHVQRCVERVSQTKIPIDDNIIIPPSTPLTRDGGGGGGGGQNGGKKGGFTHLEKSVLVLVTFLFFAILFTGCAVYWDGVRPIVNLSNWVSTETESVLDFIDETAGNDNPFNPPFGLPPFVNMEQSPVLPDVDYGLDENLPFATQFDVLFEPNFNTKNGGPIDGYDPDPLYDIFDQKNDQYDWDFFDPPTKKSVPSTTTTVRTADFQNGLAEDEEPYGKEGGDLEPTYFDPFLDEDYFDEGIPDFKFEPAKKITITTTTTTEGHYDDDDDDDSLEDGNIFYKKEDTSCIQYFGLLDPFTAKMNLEESPCSDFYEYACGGWIASHKDGTDHQKEFDVMSEIQDKNWMAILDVLNKGTRDSMSEAEFEAKMFYQSCIYMRFDSDPIYDPEVLTFDNEKVKICLNETVEKFQLVAAAMLYYHGILENLPESVSLASEMIEDIRQQHISLMMNASWVTQNDAKKISQILTHWKKNLVQFPHFLNLMTDSSLLDKYYAPLSQMKRGEYELNLIKIDDFAKTQLTRRKWGTENDEEIWSMAVGPKFDLENGNFSLPLTILQPPFIHPCHPESLNFGSLGTILGQEIGHALYQLYQTDGFGDLQSTYLRGLKITENLTDCLVDQFWDLNVNGEATLAQNVADSVGLRASFYAYQKRVKEAALAGDDEIIFDNFKFSKWPLPGSPDQPFFVAYAQNWCTTKNGWHKDESRAPHKARVLSALRDFPEFSKAFKCPLNTSMNPGKKCPSLW